MNTTTRRHPRTLAQAFPQDHADPIEHCRRPLGERVADALFATLLGVVAAALLFHGLSS